MDKIKILRVITRLNIGGPAQHVTLIEENLDKSLEVRQAHPRFESKLVIGAVDGDVH